MFVFFPSPRLVNVLIATYHPPTPRASPRETPTLHFRDTHHRDQPYCQARSQHEENREGAWRLDLSCNNGAIYNGGRFHKYENGM